MDLNTIGIIGLCYVIFWNMISMIGWWLLRKTNKKTSVSIPIMIALATIIPFILGLFGNE